MIVRFGNTAPVYVKNHDPRCPKDCPARHEVTTGRDGDDPVTELVHDDTKERIVVDISPDPYRVTESDVAVHPDTHDLSEWLDVAFQSITHPDGAWTSHSNAAPAWVESDWPDLQRRLAAWYDCPIGEPNASAPKKGKKR